MILSIVTINYKTPEKTLGCLDSVYAQFSEEFEKGEIEHIIVDNDSSDGSVKILNEKIKEKKYKNVTVLENKENAGFGKGCNFGESHAKGEYILFLNSDTEVADRGFLGMATWLDSHAYVAILGGKLKNIDGTLQLSAWKFYTPLNLLFVLLGAERFGLITKSPTKTEKVDWVSGGCMMVRKKMFDNLGRFDKHIFMYMEDMELCFRAKKEGLDTYFYPYVEVFHSSQGSSNRGFAVLHIYEGILYFYKKFMPRRYVVALFLLRCKAGILAIIGQVTGNSYLQETYAQAFKLS
jgi:GT2 family glycosyltransferase